jgi:hypothetical protein
MIRAMRVILGDDMENVMWLCPGSPSWVAFSVVLFVYTVYTGVGTRGMYILISLRQSLGSMGLETIGDNQNILCKSEILPDLRRF